MHPEQVFVRALNDEFDLDEPTPLVNGRRAEEEESAVWERCPALNQLLSL